jgi:hypothetical protein
LPTSASMASGAHRDDRCGGDELREQETVAAIEAG